MKRILSLLLCVSLSLFLVACGGNNYGNGMKRSPAVKGRQNAPLNGIAEGEPKTTPINEQVEALINEYVGDGQYTKLTTLTYDDSEGNYHAGVNTRKRRTYYDETVNALLMGDYDGGFEHINSGYAKNSENDMEHYSNNATTITIENLFSSRDANYVVRETNPVSYFDVLSEIANKVGETTADRWNQDEYGRYIYTAPEKATIKDSGNYNNELLKMFQYFAAPMLLLNNNIGLKQVAVVEKNGYVGGNTAKLLQIQLFAVNNDESVTMVSYAYVVKGLTMAEVVDGEVYLKVIDGWKESNAVFYAYLWSNNTDSTWLPMTSAKDGGNIYKITIPYDRFNNKIIFVRHNPNNSPSFDADHKWNQTQDLYLSGNIGKSIDITGWDSAGGWY